MRQSVSALFVSGSRVFHVERQNYLSVFPGYTAFPGGKVDRTDSTSPIDHFLVERFEPKLIHALARECMEELNYDLIGAIEFGDVLDISLIGRAVTPEFNPYRFENFFFKIVLDSEYDFDVDENETKQSAWSSPSEILSCFERAELLAVPPTVALFRALEKDITVKGPLDLSLPYDPDTEVPMIESIFGVKQFLPLSHTFPPANRTNCFLIGDKGRGILIDPSPRDEVEFLKLKKSISKYEISEIFITHHHPDHHEMADRLARELNIPLGMGEYTRNRMKKVWGDDFFINLTLKLYGDGDILTTSLGQEVTLFAVPGHDEGQLALAPSSMNWFLAGDLIQTIGTVVIGGEEGDMAKYFNSLQKVIDLNPKFVIPSHGIALGGTNKIQMTLKHRIQRENQIVKLHSEGKTRQEMLDILYAGLEENLKKYALKTIEAHLVKLGLDAV